MDAVAAEAERDEAATHLFEFLFDDILAVERDEEEQVATTTDVLDAQTRLSRARISYYNALYNYRISLMRLSWATGKLAL